MKIVISSGHGKYIRGAAGPSPWGLDEVNEARKVVDKVASLLRGAGVIVTTFHDDVSDDQSENLNRIVNFHNAQGAHDLDVSVHFNAYQVTTTKPMGTEVLYVSQHDLADRVCDAICEEGFINRGPKKRTDLAFLNGTNEPAILIETCFCDSKPDCDLYRQKFDGICEAIAESISGEDVDEVPPPDVPDEPDPLPPEYTLPPISERRILKKGMEGEDVAALQAILGVPADGDFGSITHEQVKSFQAACNIGSDGIVGHVTWSEVDDLAIRLATGSTGLTEDQYDAIIELAEDSPLQTYNWPGRGPSPEGYLSGMALSFAVALLRHSAEDDAALVMADAKGDSDTDAMKWYEDELADLGMDTDEAGVNMLRHLFVLMIGLGMRESSGRYCEGRDMSASNTAADTAEAALFQTSWNINTADATLPSMLDEFWENPQGFREVFRDGVLPDASDLDCYGSGSGACYQWLAKYCPLFAVFSTAVGLRTRRQHWGPINRKEVTLSRDADALLKRVQELIE